MEQNKKLLIKIFEEKVKGKHSNLTGRNIKHDGREGHWLEEQFGKHPDAGNHADFFGYELKNETTIKTTFGDWPANEYIFKNSNFKEIFCEKTAAKNKDIFCQIFGKPNPKKNNRYSWSGKPFPKINAYNNYGQILIIEKNKDIVAYYSYSKDKRENKAKIVPKCLQKDNLELARWFGVADRNGNKTNKCLCSKLKNKFGDKGWFTCKKDKNGKYNEICFGDPFTFNQWLNLVEKGIVILDSGMYQGNSRPYSMWRASNKYWDSLITEKY